jgi:Xaa-Pro aminopeptidase
MPGDPALDERTRRVAESARSAGADWALLTAPHTVCYATGFAAGIETGPLPFQGGPPVALVAPDGTSGLVVTNIERAAAEAGRATRVRDYEAFTAETVPAPTDEWLTAILALVDDLGAGGAVAFEPAFVPQVLAEALRGRFARFSDIDPWLARARAEKTPAELDLLRAAAELASIGQRVAARATVAGRTELEAFAEIRTAIEVAHGARMAMTGDYISGIERTAACEGWPNDRVMADGDPVICDLSPRADGYWGDSCDTLLVGEPPPGFLDLYRVAERAIEQAAASVRPGVPASTVAREVTEVIAASGFANPLHVGHGIGTSFHEFPRVVLEEQALLVPGMVLMLEPGAYHPERGGVRLEHMFEVTETGNRILTDFEFALRSGA